MGSVQVAGFFASNGTAGAGGVLTGPALADADDPEQPVAVPTHSTARSRAEVRVFRGFFMVLPVSARMRATAPLRWVP
ncbi:hypothetical protein JCM13580A_28510 [Streptomyces drozdowiczii]